MMEFIFDILIGFWPFWVGLAVFVAFVLLMRMYSGPGRMPYRLRGSLVTKAELRFYKSLQKSVQDDWEIFAMVRVADLIRVEENTPKRRKWLNKILAKHVDFVLCDPGSLEPQLAIELDDRSHQRAERVARDIFMNEAFESAGLPLLRVPVESSYRSREIRDLIDELI